MNQIGYSPEQAEHIPKTQGIYAFYVVPMTLAALGLYRDTEPNRKEAEVARKILRRRLRALAEILQPPKMTGRIKAHHTRGPLRINYDLECDPVPILRWVERIDSIPRGEIKPLAQLMASTGLFLTPVYVGVATRQTLSDRYTQHRQDYYSSQAGGANFGSRLYESGIEWGEVLFSCCPIEMGTRLSDATLMFAEDYFHALARPKFSLS